MSRFQNWSLRLARPADAAAMASIAAQVQNLAAFDEAQIGAIIGRRRSLFVTADKEPAGFLLARSERRELHICALAVAERFRRRGIGKGMVRAAMIDAGNGGYDALTAVLPAAGDKERDSAETESAPMSLALRLGFVPVTNPQAHARLAGLVHDQAMPGTDEPVAMIRFL